MLIYEQVLDLSWRDAWRHEERNSKGEWTHFGGGLVRDPGEVHGYEGEFEGRNVLRPGMEAAPGRKPLELPGRPGGTGTPDDPIDVQGDMNRAVDLMAAGSHVRLNSTSELPTLESAINTRADAVLKSTGAEPTWDLGYISVKGTRLFNEQTLGIPRIKMPQLSGPAQPGSEAAILAHGANKFIELDPQFRDQLRRDGVDVKYERVKTSELRATQDQLTAASVAGIARAAQQGNAKVRHMLQEPIWVSSDNYVIDGHHRWAAHAMMGDQELNIKRVGLNAALAIPYANAFSEKMGIGGRALGNSKLVEGANTIGQHRQVALAAWEHEARNKHGEWVTLYRASDPHEAQQIMHSKRFPGSHVYATNVPTSPYMDEFGPARVHLRVPTSIVKPDPDEENDRAGWAKFAPGERHYVIKASDIKPEHITGASGLDAWGTVEGANTIGQQYMELSWKDAWRTELRGPHGEWISGTEKSVEVGDMVHYRDSKGRDRTGKIISRNAPIKGHVYAAQVQFDDGLTPRTQSLKTEKLHHITPIRNEALSLHKLVRSAANPFVGAELPDTLTHEQRTALAARVGKFVNESGRSVPAMISKNDHLDFDGKPPTLFNENDAQNAGLLAEIDWHGHMSMSNEVAENIAAALDHPELPVRVPAAFTVPLHEDIHATVPAGESRATNGDRQAYQDLAHADIEEGFTELGAIMHAGDFFSASGLADRKVSSLNLVKLSTDVHLLAINSPGWNPALKTAGDAVHLGDVTGARKALAEAAQHADPATLAGIREADAQLSGEHTIGTMAEMARDLASPANIKNGTAWGRYKYQTAQAYNWLATIAQMRTGKPEEDPATQALIRYAADQVNSVGTAAKPGFMASQVVGDMLTGSADDRAIIDSAEQGILRNWGQQDTGAVVTQVRAAARQRLQALQAERAAA